MDYKSKVVTPEDLSLALQEKLSMPSEDALEVAEFVVDLFGFEDAVLDNILEDPTREFFDYAKNKKGIASKEQDQTDRTLFYMLEEQGFISPGRDETELPNTYKTWRIFYWKINREEIHKTADRRREKLAKTHQHAHDYTRDTIDVYNDRNFNEAWSDALEKRTRQTV